MSVRSWLARGRYRAVPRGTEIDPNKTLDLQSRYAPDVDSKDAANVLDSVMAQFRAKAWADLRLLVEEGFALKNTHYEEIKAPSGKVYQVRVNVYWDDKRRKHLRVCGAIDDGGWRAFVPMTESFIVDSSGKFVGE